MAKREPNTNFIQTITEEIEIGEEPNLTTFRAGMNIPKEIWAMEEYQKRKFNANKYNDMYKYFKTINSDFK